MSFDYTVIRSNRKTISISVKNSGSLEVRAPIFCSAKAIDRFVEQKSAWIQKAIEKTSDSVIFQNFTDDDYEKIKAMTAAKASAYLNSYPGKKPARLRIKKQKTVWGTCNRNGTIAINSLAGILPDPLFEYIMIHELTHLEVLNHSAYFWNLVSYYIPDWKERRAELKKYKIGT